MTPEEQNTPVSDAETTPENTALDTARPEEPSVESTALPDTPTDDATVTPAPEPEVEPPTQGSPVQSESQDVSQDAAPAVTSQTESSESSETTPAQSFPQTAPTTELGNKGKSKKGLILGIVAAVVAVLLIGGGVLAYNLWYQNPDKVVTDALGNILVAKKSKIDGTLAIKSSDVDISMSLNGQSADGSGGGDAELTIVGKSGTTKDLGTIKLSVSYVASSKDGTYYFKLGNVKSAVDKLVDSTVNSLAQQYKQYGMTMTNEQMVAAKKEYQQELSPIVTKIDNRWVKFTADDLKSSDSSSDNQSCYTDAIKQLQEDKDERNELVKVYGQHKFVTVNKKLGSKDGSLGYDLSVNKTESKAFAKAVKDTTFGKAIVKCDSDAFDTSDSSTSDSNDSKVTMQLWVTRWSHQISELKATVDTKGTDAATADIDLKLQVGKGEAVKAPSDAVSIKDLQTEIQQVYGGSASSTSSTSFSI